MTKEQFAMQILQEYAHEVTRTLIVDDFSHWHSRYRGYHRHPDDDAFEEAIKKIQRLEACLGKEYINKIFDEAEKCYASGVDPQVWALYKNEAEPPGQPVAGIADDPDPLGIPF